MIEAADHIFSRDLKRAREELAEKFREGRRVNGISLYDLLDSELDSADRYKVALEYFGGLLLGSPDYSRDELAAGIVDNLIERHLERHPELVEEEAILMIQERE